MKLQELQKEIADYGADCDDLNSTVRSLIFGKQNAIGFVPSLLQKYHVSGVLNDWAFTQVCNTLNAPAGWLTNHCPEELKVDILNELAVKWRDDKNLFIRLKGEVVRAVLSDKYSVFDHSQLIDLTAEAIQTMGIEPQVHRATVADEMRAYLVFPQITLAPDPTRDNGGLHPSMYISNSERGGGSARITGAVYRSICSNGLIMGWKTNETMAIRHMYHSRAMMSMLVAEGITTALKMSEEATVRFIKSQEVKIPKVNLSSIVSGWTERYGISVDAKENWLATITSEAASYGRADDIRLFDMVNAATYVAQSRSADETEMIERMAGEILWTDTRSR